MTETFRILYLVAMGVWMGTLLIGALAIRLAFVRLGRDKGWPIVRFAAPLTDLIGMWTGTLAAAFLIFGRTGYSFRWAAALLLVALMVTAGLYDRAVLVPSLDAAWKRLGHGTEWEDEWRFLMRMAVWGRGLTIGAGVGALAAFPAW